MAGRLRLSGAWIFTSQGWLSSFPNSSLRALPRPRSDHCPILVSASSFIPPTSLFRFESFWSRYTTFPGTVCNAWNSVPEVSDPLAHFSAKLLSIQRALMSWSAGLSSGIKLQGDRCLRWIECLDRAEEHRPLIGLEGILRSQLKMRYEELCLLEEMKWRQRSRVQWLKAGDSNTKFFHCRANCRRILNRITKISDGTSSFSSPVDIANHLHCFFRNQLGAMSVAGASINLQLLYGGAVSDLSSLHAPFTSEEVSLAVFSSPPEKAPGPDGFPMLFYQLFWDTIKEDVMGVFEAFFSGALNLDSVNSSWICLIPKKPEILTA